MAPVFEFPTSASSGINGSHTKSLVPGQAKTAMDATFEMVSMKGDNRGVVIAVQETHPATTQGMPSVTIQPPSPAGRSVTPPARTQPTRPPVDRFTPQPTQTPPTTVQQMKPPKRALTIVTGHPPSPLRMSTYPNPPTTRPTSPEQSSMIQQWNRSTPTLVRKGSLGSTGTHSPVMRSMFPRYSPVVPLARQNYVPTMEHGMSSTVWQAGPSTQQTFSPTSYSLPESPLIPARSNWRNTNLGAGSMNESPLHVSDVPPPNLSTPEELLDMWSIANGKGSLEAADTYTLGLLCSDLTLFHETLSLTSTTRPIYTLSATASSLTITRTHPLSPSPKPTPITTTTISTPSATSPLITSIFPKLAELMALEHASAIALAHSLSATDTADLRAEALHRTRDAEAASLLWDSDSAAYYLVHPTLADGEPATFPFAIDDAITRISLLASTAPGAEPLLELELETNTLVIRAGALKVPDALYVLDTLLAATLALLLHLHRAPGTSSSPPPTIASPAPTFHFAPPPTTAFPSSSKTIFSKPPKSKSLSRRLHPLRRAPTSPSLSPSPTQTLDIEKGLVASVAPELHARTGVDLSRFQAYDLADPELAAGTRAVLRVLYWLFGCVVWVLGVGVGILAAGVVAVGGCVGRL